MAHAARENGRYFFFAAVLVSLCYTRDRILWAFIGWSFFLIRFPLIYQAWKGCRLMETNTRVDSVQILK